MKEKVVEMCMLYDFYGDMLTEKQRELFDLYFNEDLSLAEIAEHKGITRQGVRDSLVRSETILRGMETKLGLVERYGQVEENVLSIARDVKEIADLNRQRYRDTSINKLVESVLRTAGKLVD